MQFHDEIAGGVTLVRPALQSPDYVTGVSGWAVMIDGSAEFNDVTIRGGTVTQGEILLYNGSPAAGNLVISLAPDAGTDDFGNTYPAGFRARSNLGSLAYTQITPFGQIVIGNSAWDNGGGISTSASALSLFSPADNSGTADDSITLALSPGDSDGTPRGEASLGSSSINGQDIDFTVTGTIIAAPRTTTSTGMVVNSAAGTTADLLSLRVDSDSKFTVDENGVLTTYADSAFTTYTPVVTGGGAVTWTTRTGWYQRVGPMVFFTAYLVVNGAGSGATPISIDGPVSIDRTTRQTVGAHVESLTAGNNGSCRALAFTGGSGATFDRLRNSTNGSITGADLLAGGLIIVEGWVREA